MDILDELKLQCDSHPLDISYVILHKSVDEIQQLRKQVAELEAKVTLSVDQLGRMILLYDKVQEQNTIPSTDEWIKRSQLEFVGIGNNVRDGSTTTTYRYRETK